MKRYKYLLLFFLAIFTLQATAQQSSAELKKKKQALQREIDLLQKGLNQTSKSKKLTQSQINALTAKITLMEDKIAVINTEMKRLDSQITENKNTVLSLKEQLAQLKKQYAAMVRFAQKNRNGYEKMMFVFASKDFYQAYKRVKYLQEFSQYRKKQANFIMGKEQNLNEKIVVLDKNLKEKSSLLAEQENEQHKLAKDKTQQAEALNKISKQEKQYKQDLASRMKQRAAIDRSIKDAIRREIEIARRKALEKARLEAARARAAALAKAKAEAAALARAQAKARAENKPVPKAPKVKEPEAEPEKVAGNPLTATPESAKLSSAFQNNRGSLPWPVASGSITEGFGRHKQGQATYDNSGITITTAPGAAVRAVFSGKVTTVRPAMGSYFVLIKHGEYFTVYQNLHSVSVSPGETVSTKQTIGTMSSSGSPELQFQIFRGISAQNPAGWISR
ncbi:murein hydrolase activator EnvC family protein [Pedobacter nutrimenti]|jgi:septal ring factor EnvC (AmiA/AmiB activator)|uniref:Septal ring factor EnvC (AmiA/AmiB activator) n=1 Tax=Pedobacter nutrimenti TaxID=1241337 RepID=A0A318UTT1_9SPHI|nr:peptidoglycan DD-metalloendopeptidase family protein [Pedobacter nutrimenti]PYF75039.1 septal ring factor EnvC (AmiA/AmiB activator) [Pedobacter nutrimenti]